MHAAVAAGFHPDIHAAAKKMARIRKKVYRPNLGVKVLYDCLYGEYTRLHDLFGRDPTSTMKVLRRLKAAAYTARV
jgi:L-ribulokinase